MKKIATGKKNSRSYARPTVGRVVRMNRPLEYAVYCGKKCVIPAGATGVSIRFRASHLHRIDEDGNTVPMNVYYWKGKIYHA
jgi:hypothetical protein